MPSTAFVATFGLQMQTNQCCLITRILENIKFFDIAKPAIKLDSIADGKAPRTLNAKIAKAE